MNNKLTAEKIARVCHEANRAYCLALGDTSQVPWDDAPAWQRTSAADGVRALIENPLLSAEAQHESWMKEKTEKGWNWGPVKDAEKKEHPSLRPYDQLPVEERLKDTLFQAVAKALI